MPPAPHPAQVQHPPPAQYPVPQQAQYPVPQQVQYPVQAQPQQWPGAAQGPAAGWPAAPAAAVAAWPGGPAAAAPPGGSGDHWPLPDGLLARLPHLPIVKPVDPHDAEVPFSGSGSAIDWLTYAAEVHERDKAAEGTKSKLLTWGVVCLIGGILTLVFFGLGLIPIGISIYLFVRRSKLNKFDVDDRRLEAFTGMLRTLAPELKAKKPITVELDFTAHTRHARNAGEYAQQWLSLKLPLQDGSHALVTVTVQVKERKKSKRKYTKIRRKQQEQIIVRLTPAVGKAFSPNPRANQIAGRSVNGLTLRQALVQPHQACFTWSSWVSIDVRARAGWTSHAPPLDSRHLVTTLIVSYKLARAAEREAA